MNYAGENVRKINGDHIYVFWLCPEIERFWGNGQMTIVTIPGYLRHV